MLQLSRAFVLASIFSLAACATQQPRTPLKLDVFTAGASGYGVTSTIIYGEHEAMVVDAQLTNSDAREVAKRIDALGRRVTTIFITHPDADHFIGLALLHERYPQAKIYMTAAALKAFPASAAKAIGDYKKGKRADEAPDAEPTPEVLPGVALAVDGWPVEIIPDMPGDFTEARANSSVWIPSIKALVTGDMAFNDVHMWLDKSTPDWRKAWREALVRLEAMHPAVVVAGHKRTADTPDTPTVLEDNRRYLETFDRLRAANADAKAFEAAMKAAFPERGDAVFLQIASASAS